MAVLWTFREFSLCRHVRRELLRKAALNLTLIIPVTVCHQISYVERYSRFMQPQSQPFSHSEALLYTASQVTLAQRIAP